MSKIDVTIYLLKFALETLEANDLENTRNKDNWVIGRDIETHLADLANAVETEKEQCNLPVVRQRALKWWNDLPRYDMDKPCKRTYAQQYLQREPSNLTGGEIQMIYFDIHVA